MSRPAVLIGLDAVEVSLVDDLCAAGKLPVLASLRKEGRSGLLETRPQAFASMVWPTFTSGTQVADHGWYFNKVWRHEHMRLEYVNNAWLPLQPFWRALDSTRVRLVLLDVPFAPLPPRDFPGVFLAGWQNHDDFGKHARPAGLWRDLERRFGRPALGAELFGRQSPATLLRLRAEALASIDQFGRICESLLRRGEADLFLAVFGGAHRGTHYLWDLSQVQTRGLDRETVLGLGGARVEIYEALDRALGRLLEAAPREAAVLIFALHGMGPNTGWWERFEAMAARVQAGGAAPPRRGVAYRLKRALPWKLARQVTTRLPARLNQALVPLWSRRMYDWGSVRWFPLPLDLHGFIRVNLRGRETPGVVAPGAEYEGLLRDLEAAFLSFRDLASGEPAAAAAEPVDGVVSPGAARRAGLPDLAVRFGERSARDSTGVRSERHGEVRWEPGEPFPSGRSGNHRGRGWFVARGPGIAPGTCAALHDIVDLAPTVCRWLGAAPPAGLAGRSIAELAGAAADGRAAPPRS